VLRTIFPAMVNEVIALLKETALIGTISGLDLMRMAQVLGAEQFTYFRPLCIAGAYYYGLVLLIEWGGRRMEKRGSHAHN
jgi:polar amino acid transport system permease protein